jgi:hypothetical protein
MNATATLKYLKREEAILVRALNGPLGFQPGERFLGENRKLKTKRLETVRQQIATLQTS